MRHDFLGKSEKLLIGGALSLFVVCMYCLLFDPTIFGLWESKHKKSNQPIVGQITFLENDTRRQQEGTLGWEQAKNKQSIHLGDSVFTGSKSRSQVSFVEGGYVDLGENTLLTFTKVKNEKLPNLAEGNFRLQVHGEMKLAIAGEVTEIKGDRTEVQVFMDKKINKPQLKVLKGKALVKQGSAPAVELKINQVSALRPPNRIPSSVTETELEAVKIEEPKTVQTLQQADETIFYISKFYDFYERKENAIVRRDQRPNYVSFQKKLSWITQGDVQKVSGQLSSTSEFDKSVLPFETSQKEFSLNQVFLGENHWRLSLDSKNWLPASKFFVKSAFLPNDTLKIAFPQSTYAMFNQPISIKGVIQAPADITNFVFEFSRVPSFPNGKTNIHWLSKNQLSLKLNSRGSYYLRVRGVNQKMEITDFSEVVEIKADKPELPEAPRLAKENFNVFEGESVQLGWSNSSESDFEVLITDKNGKLVANKIMEENKFSWKTKKPGIYKAQISALDEWGQKSTSVQAIVQVKPKSIEPSQLQPTLSKASEPIVEPVRKPSSLPTTQSAMSLNMSDDNTNKNLALTSSKLQFEGAVFSMHVQEQEANPSVLAFTGRLINWWDSNGFEGSIKSKAASLDNNPNVPAPLQLEARYHHRWLLPFNLFSPGGSTQFSLIGGYEFYRNPTQGYSPQYDLVKTGFAVDFPVMRNWDTGGEILYGYGMDQSTKYEISGRLNYYIQRKWSMGVGYRMHLFEAGSNKSAPPIGVPYREAYGEGYSVLRWHY